MSTSAFFLTFGYVQIAAGFVVLPSKRCSGYIPVKAVTAVLCAVAAIAFRVAGN